ncbi:hypothetical protein KAFR_0C06580 [Kazachstania africana CBS 2517]|uniref:Uncharacterized protein n=1 Tax=Kazachstania africana (strain ATCC 22294 / BCRC 22015 / CBS 2517 / CECT 1963 / NBRC 1671 / NRRL Y-8276) TaxID=1071382 RepID=H2ATF3_KAZAF|nr:hypothetical protein KAFR_0C06580 [Kazachstania africana CBS 2517]CCF57653.1 hypothetical protein KAFR_0C06580 [Kazachstania africana CBS 2517]
MTAGALTIPYIAASVCLATTSGVCAPLAGLILSTVDVVVAAIVLGQSEGDVPSKRNLGTFEDWNGPFGSIVNISVWPHDNSSVISTVTRSQINFNYVAVTSQSNSSLSKRDSTTLANSLHFTSQFGNHVASSIVYTAEELSQLIVTAVPGQLVNSNFTKRTDTFEVSWLSYNFDNSNKGLAYDWYEAEGGSFDSVLEEELTSAITKNPDWKYCFSPAMVKAGEALDFDDIPGDGDGTGNVAKGEIYFNTYGGIDSFCNDAYDGTDRY